MAEIKQIKRVDIKKLIPYVNNAKQHSEDQITRIASSIREFGFVNPVIIDKEFNIIAGHGRVMAAKKLELTEVPCLFVEGLTEAQRKAYILADNRLGELAEWDMELVTSELEMLDELDFDIDLTGFELPEDIEETEIVEDEIPEEVETRCKLGDLWELGEHRLICGDSTDVNVIDRLMDGAKADMVFTDPPYGMKKESEGVLNDNLNFDDLLDFNRQWIPLTFGALKDNGSWYCWGIDEPLMDIYSNILKPMQKENKITFRNLITWNKSYLENGNTFNPFGASGSKWLRMFPIADEKCLFVMMGVQGFSNNADNYFEAWEPIRIYLKQERDRMGWSNADMKKMCGHSPTSGCHWFDKSQWMMPTEEEYKTWQHHAKGEGFKKEYDELKKEYYSTRAYFDNADCSNNVWNIEITKGKEKQEAGGHATPKPIALCSRAIKSSSREGEIVLDCFGGSGSTLIACEQLNRKCFMCELDPHYCDVIIQRWENLTGEKAELINE